MWTGIVHQLIKSHNLFIRYFLSVLSEANYKQFMFYFHWALIFELSPFAWLWVELSKWKTFIFLCSASAECLVIGERVSPLFWSLHALLELLIKFHRVALIMFCSPIFKVELFFFGLSLPSFCYILTLVQLKELEKALPLDHSVW